MPAAFRLGRREFLLTAAAALLGRWRAARALERVATEPAVRPLPLAQVRLLPSRYREALEANHRYVLSLDADRLLHNYRRGAGLVPKAEAYGGWEAETIAGHTLGHWLSALSLLHAQTGDREPAERAAYVVAELGACQRAHGDGYVGGFTRRRADGSVVDGKELFAEVSRGEIRAQPFDLNGCWVPLYNWHKLLAGLRDADRLCGLHESVAIAEGVAGFLERSLAGLDAGQLQSLLACEHGGISESLADLYERTGERRWLALAERLYHHRVLDPLAAGRDELAGLHANTQIPKLIGLARLAALTGEARHRATARFFWHAVVRDHSYVIGGNSDGEYFQAPRSPTRYLTEQTCEGCNTYNMLKLTRELYAAEPDARLFDFYERAHLNHVLAQQDPATGAFTYMTPLRAGAAREYSEATGSFWCCVGTGMESHAKHGDSIYWQDAATLYVNLYIPSTLDWREHDAELVLTTAYPDDGRITLTLRRLAAPRRFALALRRPAWCGSCSVAVNGRPVPGQVRAGYVVVERRWRAGDVATLTLGLEPRLEPAPGDPASVSVLRGPLVLAADLGPDSQPYDGEEPALVAAGVLARLEPVDAATSRYRTLSAGRPHDWALVPFHAQHRRRSAVYLRRLDDAQWLEVRRERAAEANALEALDARTVDAIAFGEEPSERAHALEAANSNVVLYRGRRGRDARSGGHLAFALAVGPGPLALHVAYWGEERPRTFSIRVDGAPLATQRLAHDAPGKFLAVEYPIAETLTAGKSQVTVRVEPEDRSAAGPLYDCRIVRLAPPTRVS
ncbi:MAG: glycoside hydrolase family 127 protein [Proteobacteria bacterium]|nr:glycoside hydrolase family 127 protein [Pseudomonadota bacterium]